MALVPTIERDRLVAQLQPLPRLLRIVAPAGYGKTILARALLARSAPAGVCDLAYAADPPSIVRGAVEAILTGEDEQRRAAVVAQFLGVGESASQWIAFGQSILRDISAPRVLCFENSEAIAGHPELCRTIEDLLRAASRRLHVISCARIDLSLRLSPFAGPDQTLVIDADDLRFDREEITRVFAGIALDRPTIERIVSYTEGWPIVVMMLRMLAKRGRLKEHLQGRRDEADLYGYLANEVYRYLNDAERAVLEVLAAIPDATESDLCALIPSYTEHLVALERETPFVTRNGNGTIEVHPALREMIASRRDPGPILERLFDVVPRDDGGIRAAQIALHMGRPRQAASALVSVEGGYWLTTPTPELNTLLSAFPSDILTEFPQLWNVSTYARAYGEDPLRWIEEGEQVYAACDDTTPDAVRAGVASSVMNAYIRQGLYGDLERFAKRLLLDSSASFRPLADSIVTFWRTGARAYRGLDVDVATIEERFKTFVATPSSRALIEYDMIARHHRIQGDRVQERVVLKRAVDRAVSTQIPYLCALVVMDAAFGAWFWGEDDLFESYLRQLEMLVTPPIERACRHFIGCARGRAAKTPVGTEKLKSRAYAFAIAASLERHAAARVRYLREAVIAADQADQAFAQVLARTGVALCADGDERDRNFDEAQRIANGTDSQALKEAARAVRAGQPGGTMFAAFATRFVPATISVSCARRVEIDLAAGTVAISGVEARLSEREAELVALLALRGTVHRDDILDALWPEFDGDRAAALLKTYVSRLRKTAGDKAFIVLEPTGYRLGASPSVRKGDNVATRVRRWRWFDELRSPASG